MSGRAQFIQIIENLITNNPNAFNAEALEYWETLKAEPAKADITEKGMLILKHMADNKDICNNVFTAQLIGAGIQLTGRSVSGAMKKLVTEGYVDKLGDAKPIAYQITERGIQKVLSSN